MLNNHNPTIKDIAKIAGFSHVTVSRVLNNKGVFYSNKTKMKILKIAKDLNYTPNIMAKNLKERKTKIIAYLIPTNSGIYFSIYNGIKQIADKKGYKVSIFISDFDENKEKTHIETILSNRVEGIIIASSLVDIYQINSLKKRNIPIVLVDRADNFKEISSVNINNKRITLTGIEFLIAKNYKKIGFLSGPLKHSNSKKRFSTYKETLSKYNISYEESRVFILDDLYWLKGDYETPYKIIKEIMIKNIANLDSLFINSATLPIIVLKILYELKIKVPEDIAILGFNELPLSKYMYIPITSIISPTREMGAEAMRILLKTIKNNTYSESIELEAVLEIRDSV